MDSQDIIASAERIVAELWEAKKIEDDVEESMPPCPEAAEDEAARVEAFAKDFAMKNIANAKGFTLLEIDRYSNEGLVGIAVYEIKGIVEFNYGKCDSIHESPVSFCAIRIGEYGSLLPLASETILDRSKEILEKRRGQGGLPAARITLDDLADGIANRLKTMISKVGPDDDDDLPPAASVGPDDDDDGLPPAAVAGPDDDDLPPAAIVVEEAKPTPAAIAEYRVMPWNDEEDDGQPSLLRRLCNRLRRR